MKIIKFKNSLLLLRLNTNTDFVNCYFIFFASWNCFKTNKLSFDLSVLNLAGVKQFYVNLADEWNRKYRI